MLLVHQLGYPGKTAIRDVSGTADFMLPLVLARVAAYLKTRNIDSELIDGFARPKKDSLIQNYLQTEKQVFIRNEKRIDGESFQEFLKSILCIQEFFTSM